MRHLCASSSATSASYCTTTAECTRMQTKLKAPTIQVWYCCPAQSSAQFGQDNKLLIELDAAQALGGTVEIAVGPSILRLRVTRECDLVHSVPLLAMGQAERPSRRGRDAQVLEQVPDVHGLPNRHNWATVGLREGFLHGGRLLVVMQAWRADWIAILPRSRKTVVENEIERFGERRRRLYAALAMP